MYHTHFLKKCLTLAKQSTIKGNHPFGALLVHKGKIVTESENEVETKQDVTAHAELLLVQKAQKLLTPQQLADSTLYCSTEPCPMCLGAIFWSGIGQVVHAFSGRKLTRLTGYGFMTSSERILKESSHSLKMESIVGLPEFQKIHLDFWPSSQNP